MHKCTLTSPAPHGLSDLKNGRGASCFRRAATVSVHETGFRLFATPPFKFVISHEIAFFEAHLLLCKKKIELKLDGWLD